MSESSLRVCLFSQQFGSLWSGVGSYTNDLVRVLSESGCEVTVVSPPARALPEGDYSHVPVRPFPLDPTPGGWVSLSRAFRSVLLRRDGLNPRDFDVLHFTDAREALCLPEGLPPVVGTVHDCYAAEARRNPFYYRRNYGDGFRRYAYYHLAKSLELRAYRRLDRLIVNSEFVRESMGGSFQIPERLMDVVEVGIDAPRELGAPAPLLDGDPSILFVGSNFFRKGLPSLARAVALLSREDLSQVEVHVVGRDRNQGELEKLLQLLGVSDRFHFHGRLNRDRTRAMFQRVEVTCVPSLVEAFGLVYLESMMAGTPVIAGNVGGTVEFLRDGENGFLVSPNEPREIADRIRFLRENPEERLAIVGRARATAARHSGARMGHRTIEIYRAMIGNGAVRETSGVWRGDEPGGVETLPSF